MGKTHIYRPRRIPPSPPVPLPPLTADPAQGLSRRQVEERIRCGWTNDPGEPPSKSEGQIIRENLFTFFNFIFLALAVLLVIAGSYKNMLFLVIAAANAAIGTIQQIRSKRTVDKLSLVAEKPVPVVREGVLSGIRSHDLVRDDIVELALGDQVCADGILRSGELQVNESLLTGEADAIRKGPGDRLLSGSFVVSGRGRFQLTQVGPQAYAARLAREAKMNPKAAPSEMTRALDRLIRWVGIALLPIGGILFYRQYTMVGGDYATAAEATVAALIGMIPEGLYLLTSVALALSALRLARKRVLVQDLKCIETLARVDVLCVDKTGTITEDRLEVGELIPLFPPDALPWRVEDVLNAIYTGTQPDNDTARAMTDHFSGRDPWPCLGRVPFNSQAKWTAAVFNQGAFLVGAPEFILGSRYGELRQQVEAHSAQGHRILLLAQYDSTPELGAELSPGLVRPLALISLRNRIRPSAPETFRYFAQEGVSIRVISGDDPLTVSVVAAQAGIADAEKYVNAATLETDEEVARAAGIYTVFGRVTPEMKMRLVRALKTQGHTVAMTGDGVNDVLALKEADCGIAMASGAQAASQVSKLVLLDSDFSAMPGVVTEGRRVINNIQRSAALFLVKNIFSFFLAMIALFATFPYPVFPIHLSMISGLTIGVPSFFLALEPNMERIRGAFLPGVFRRAFPGGLTNLAAVLLAVWCFDRFSLPEAQLHTVTAVLMTFTGLLVLALICRPFSRGRATVWGLMALACGFCFAFLGRLFEFVPLSSGSVLVLLGAGVTIPVVLLVLRWLCRPGGLQ